VIRVTVRYPDEPDVVYTAYRATQDISGPFPGDLMILLVEERLESDEFIGPQVDEFVGAWGNWDHPINIVAAFMDAADEFGASVQGWELSEDEANWAAALAAASDNDVDGS
jgi:hypothetical protein